MNKLHLYTGNGKGKTTAAMGLALRFAGHGKPVLIAQFMKDGTSGELNAFRQLGNVSVCPCPPVNGFIGSMTEQQRAETIQSQTDYAAHLCTLIEDTAPGMIILDELGTALSLNAIDPRTASLLIRTALRSGETVITGYQAPDDVRKAADYISVISCERHPYSTENLPAREGIEW